MTFVGRIDTTRTPMSSSARVAFAEALTVFGDPFEVTVADPDHSVGEYRFLSVGMSLRGRMLVVSYVERAGSDSDHQREASFAEITEAV